MVEPETDADESSTNQTSRRNALRLAAGMGATGIIGSLAGCEGDLDELKPVGQTVVYKTPQGELREGEMGVTATDETTTPNNKQVVNSEQSVASIGNTNGRLSLSPDASEVAYIDSDKNSADWGTAVAIEGLNGGDERHSRSDLQSYWPDAVPNSIDLGNLLALDWCPASGSDRLALTVDGRSELNGKLLFEFDRGKTEVKLLGSAHRPNLFSPNMAWSPSCDKFAYREEPGPNESNPALTVLNVSTEKNTQRVQSGEDPAWGDTGIAFVRNGNVYLDTQNGTVQITSAAATDSNPVIFDQDPGESLAFRRNNEMYLVERIDQFGSNPNPSPKKVTTEEPVATFDIMD